MAQNTPVRINGVLYPSQEWYEKNVAKRQATTNLSDIQKKIGEIKTQTQNLLQKTTEVLPVKQLQKIPGIDLTKINQPPDIRDSLNKIRTQADIEMSKAQNWNDLMTAWKQRVEPEAKLKEQLAGERQTIWEKIQNLLTTQSSTKSLWEEEQKKWGIPQTYQQIQNLVPEITSLREELNRLDAKEMELQDKLMNEPLPSWLIDRRKSALQQEYMRNRAIISSELGTKVALMNALQGNINTAMSLAQKAVDAAIYDTKQELQRYTTLYELYGDQIKELDEDIQNIIKTQASLWEKKEQEEKEDLQKKMNWILAYTQNTGIVPDISMEDLKNMSDVELLKQLAPGLQTIKEERPLSISDILNLNATYGINLLPGTTASQAAAEIQRIQSGQLTGDEAKASVSQYIQAQTQNTGKEPKEEEVIDWINSQNWTDEAKKSAIDFVREQVYGGATKTTKKTFLQRVGEKLSKVKDIFSLKQPQLTEEETFPAMPVGTGGLFDDYINKTLEGQINTFNYEYQPQTEEEKMKGIITTP